MNVNSSDREICVNPYAPPSEPSVSSKVVCTRPAFGPILIIATATLFAGFLGYLLVCSPPDRWPATVLSTIIPGLAVYAWMLRFRSRYTLQTLASICGLFLTVFFYLAIQPEINGKPLLLMFIVLSTPVFVVGMWTWISLRRSGNRRQP